jgi:hypothetical protein
LVKIKPLGALNNYQIEKYMKGQTMFGGVYSNDDWQNDPHFAGPDPKKIYILNLQNSDQSGSHWVLLHNHEYYDSYAAPPTQQIQPHVKRYNGNDYQSLYQDSCGYYVLFIADNIIAGRAPTHGLKDDESRYNENVLKKYFKTHNKTPK